MKHTDSTEDGRGRDTSTTAVDFDRLRERAASLRDAGTARAVREELAHIVLDELDPDAVGVYRREGDRYRAAVRTSATDSVSAPEMLPGDCSPVLDVVEAGGTRCGRVSGDAFGDISDYCITPLNGDGIVLTLASEPDSVGPDTAAAVSMLVGCAEGALTDVEGGILRRAATSNVRPDVPEDELLDALSHAFPDYAFIYDGDGTYLDVLLGLQSRRLDSPEELVGENVRDLYDTEPASRIVSAIRTAIGTGEVQRVEYSLTDANRTCHYEGRIARLSGDGRGGPSALLVARDVTERHERERDLRQQNERLEEFASIVSHDLRNPLNTASGFLTLLMEDVDDERIQRIDAAHDRMEALIDDLLALARNGRTVTDLRPVDLGSAAEQAWGTVTPDGTLEVTDSLAIRADPNRFRQVLENLVRNAAEHAPPAPTVRVGPLDDGEGFYVADDGPGIPEENREDVFETGYTSVAGGTGLGLAIVERIAEAHDWTVAATESDTGGARFEFRGVDVVDDDGRE